MALNADSTDVRTLRDRKTVLDSRAGKRKSNILRRALGASWHRFRKHVLYDTLMYPYARFVHRRLGYSAERSQAHTYTSFYRSPDQLDALVTQVVPFFGDGKTPKTLSINVVACSTGAEAYTIASELMHKFPDLDFNIEASDLHEHTVRQAKAGTYSVAEVLNQGEVTDEFLARTFDRVGDTLVVKQRIRERVSFREANLLDPSLAAQFSPADIVFAQNVFFHLYPTDAEVAFKNVLKLLKHEKAALFVDGTELDMKVRLTREAGLEPLPYKVREIYSYARKHIPEKWWNYYYGAEPYFMLRTDKLRRYSTIFLQTRDQT